MNPLTTSRDHKIFMEWKGRIRERLIANLGFHKTLFNHWNPFLSFLGKYEVEILPLLGSGRLPDQSDERTFNAADIVYICLGLTFGIRKQLTCMYVCMYVTLWSLHLDVCMWDVMSNCNNHHMQILNLQVLELSLAVGWSVKHKKTKFSVSTSLYSCMTCFSCVKIYE
jgi:hypothetical protein